MTFASASSWLVGFFFLVLLLAHAREADAKNKNLLFMITETTRADDIEFYRGLRGLSPSLRGLFSRNGSLIVDQFHADYPLCNPSRTSILLGRSSDSTAVKTNYVDWRMHPSASSWKSLPKVLREQGWYTIQGGRVFHRGFDDSSAWDRRLVVQRIIDQEECQKDRKARKLFMGLGKSISTIIGCSTRAREESLFDSGVVIEAKDAIRAYSQSGSDKPFAMFLGFQTAHAPLRVLPKYLFDRTRLKSIIPKTEPQRIRSDYPSGSYSLVGVKHIVNGRFDSDRSHIPAFIMNGDAFSGDGSPKSFREALRWLHLSGLRQLDAAIGQLLKRLENLGYLEDTVVIMTSDHGFAYGETRLWGKDIPFDVATRVPLLMRVPWLSSKPRTTPQDLIMSSVDLYRTITGFLGIANESIPATVGGKDLSPYLSQLSRHSSGEASKGLPVSPSTFAVTQVIRCSDPAQCRGTLQAIDIVGYSIRTPDFRYTAFFSALNGLVRDLSKENVFMEELYDHRGDNATILNPAGTSYVNHEFRNIARDEGSDVIIEGLFTTLVQHLSSIERSDVVLPRGAGITRRVPSSERRRRRSG